MCGCGQIFRVSASTRSHGRRVVATSVGRRREGVDCEARKDASSSALIGRNPAFREVADSLLRYQPTNKTLGVQTRTVNQTFVRARRANECAI